MQKMWTKIQQKNWLTWLGVLLLAVILAALWKPTSQVGADPALLRSWIEELGPLAPVVFFLLNVIQIVVAPGYPVQVLGGVLFGFIPGAVYTVGGMVVGGTLAAWLGRRLGRPWLEKQVDQETLEYWSRAVHINSFWTWWIILVIPMGDIPYFIAGLSKIRLSTFALAILASRGPFTLLIVWTGNSVIGLPIIWLVLLMAAIIFIIILGFSQRSRFEAWGRAYVAYVSDKKQGSK